MKRALAMTIMGAAWSAAATSIGAAVRGPFADDSLPRNFGVGATVLAAAIVVGWAGRELEKSE